jgi:DNA (cytosine-5)-methyltransferase 3A
MQTAPQTEQIVILSLFDGMGCGAIALTNLGVNFKYYASEVDKFATAQTKHNFPNVIHLGDVRNVDVSQLSKIDIIMGGSPCQSFSFAGKQKGMVTTTEIKITTLAHYLELKAAGFEFEGQSYLFWEYMRILEGVRKINPDVEFLLENVEMAKYWEGILSRAIGVYPVHINSNLVSAQNRPRVYWTNFQTKENGLFGEVVTDIPQPADRKIFLKDILQPENEVAEKYYLSEKAIAGFTAHTARHKAKGDGFEFAPFEDFNVKGRCITSTEGRRGYNNFLKIDKKGNVKPNQDKASCFTAGAHSGGNHSDMDLIMIQHPRGFNDGGDVAKDGKTPTLTQNSLDSNHAIIKESRIRRLTPTEAARLQTVPPWYGWIASDTQIYKMCGNGWTVSVIEYLLTFSKTIKNQLK